MTVTVTQVPFKPTLSWDEVTVAYFKANYLTGLTFMGSDGQELPPAYFEDKIATSIAKFEDITHLDVFQRVNVSEKHDYHALDYMNYAYIQLYRIPAQTVQEVRAVYPTGQTIQIFPSEWVKLQQEHSQLHLVPTAGTLGQVMIGQYLPLFFPGSSYLPQLWEVDYVSGFAPDALPRSVVDALMKYAAIEILQSLSDLIGPLGVTSSSLGVDGLSQSTSRQPNAFQARIDAYKRDLGLDQPDFKGGLIQQLRRTYGGIVVASL